MSDQVLVSVAQALNRIDDRLSGDHPSVMTPLSFRDESAIAAMQGMIAQGNIDPEARVTIQDFAKAAFKWADAMVAEREKGIKHEKS